MIVSYETLRTLTALLVNCNIGLLLCDEGHRLKNSGRLTHFQELNQIATESRFLRQSNVPSLELAQRQETSHPYRNSHPE